MKRRRFGTIRKLPSGRFQAAYVDPISGLRTPAAHTFRTKTDADHWLVDVEAKLLRGDVIDIRLGRTPFRTWAQHWLDTRQVRPNTLRGYRETIELHLTPRFGSRSIETITRADVMTLVAEITRSPQKAAQAAKVRRTLSMIMIEAVRSNAIRQNPAEGVRVRRGRREEMVFLARLQVNRLALEIEHPPHKRRSGRQGYPEYNLLVRFVVETGLRAGEVAALRVGRVDLQRRRIHVVETVSEVKKSEQHPDGLHYDEPKNYERRSVPIPDGLIKELKAHMATLPDASPGAFVFLASNGGQLRHSNFYRRYFKPAVTRAKIPEGTRFHDLSGNVNLNWPHFAPLNWPHPR